MCRSRFEKYPSLADAFSVASELGEDIETVMAWPASKFEMWVAYFQWRRMKQDEQAEEAKRG